MGENDGFMKYAKSLEGKYYGRLFYNIEKQSLPSGGDVTHVSHVLHNMDPQNSIVDTCADKSGKMQYEFNWGDDRYGKESAYRYKMVTNKWICAEWQIDHTNQEYNFWVDGELVPDISGRVPKGRNIPSTYPNLWFGAVVFAKRGDEVSGWMDDIAISHSRIGCGASPPGPPPPPSPPSPRPPPPPPGKCTTVAGTDTDKDEYKSAHAADAAACCDLCTADSRCRFAVLADKQCYLKDTNSPNRINKSGCTLVLPQ